MNKVLKIIDELINKIPRHIQGLIQKGAIAAFILISLYALASSIINGMKDAKVGGFQTVEKSDDLFYLERLRQENQKKVRLIEDIEYDLDSMIDEKLENRKLYKKLQKDTLDHLRGEKDDFQMNRDTFRSVRDVPSFLDGDPASLKPKTGFEDKPVKDDLSNLPLEDNEKKSSGSIPNKPQKNNPRDIRKELNPSVPSSEKKYLAPSEEESSTKTKKERKSEMNFLE